MVTWDSFTKSCHLAVVWRVACETVECWLSALPHTSCLWHLLFQPFHLQWNIYALDIVSSEWLGVNNTGKNTGTSGRHINKKKITVPCTSLNSLTNLELKSHIIGALSKIKLTLLVQPTHTQIKHNLTKQKRWKLYAHKQPKQVLQASKSCSNFKQVLLEPL